MAILDTITRDDVRVKFVEVSNKMARKCKINGETLNLMFLFIGEIFSPTTLKWSPGSLLLSPNNPTEARKFLLQ